MDISRQLRLQFSCLALCFVILVLVEAGESSRRVQGVKEKNKHRITDVEAKHLGLSQDHSQSGRRRQVKQYAVDEVYVEWTSWSACNRSCKQHRLRRCRKPEVCDTHVIKEKRSCKKTKRSRKCRKHGGRGGNDDSKRARSVKGRLEDIVYGLFYYDWSAWSECSPTCKRRRYRMCALWRWCRNTVMLEEESCCEVDQPSKNDSGEHDTETRKTDTAEGKYYAQLGFNYRIDNNDQQQQQQGQDRNQQQQQGHKKQQQQQGQESNQQQQKPEKHRHHYNTRLNSKKTQNSDTRDKGRPASIPDDADDEIPADCGISNVTRSLRIIGGSQSVPGKWPWQVAILTRWREQYCGGVLLTPRYVLTAAHCVRKRGRRRKVIIRAGEYDLGQFDPFEMDVKVAQDFVHPSFNLTTIDSDIALLRLRVPVTRTQYRGFACLPKENTELPPKTNCYIMGWGKTKNTHIYGVDVMREAPIPLVRDRVCQRAFNYEITPNQMCAGYRRGGIDTCAGDSGGPLMCQSADEAGVKRWYVYGVTSFGEGCGEKGKYGIYTKVPKFSNWIIKTMSKSQRTS